MEITVIRALYPLPCGCWQLLLSDGRELPAHDRYAETAKARKVVLTSKAAVT